MSDTVLEWELCAYDHYFYNSKNIPYLILKEEGE